MLAFKSIAFREHPAHTNPVLQAVQEQGALLYIIQQPSEKIHLGKPNILLWAYLIRIVIITE